MKKSKIIIPAIIVMIVIILSQTLLLSKGTSVLDKRSVVKLYAGGLVAASWEAIGEGRIDGESYVFNTSSTLTPRMVRICGTYSVEQIPE